MQHHQQQLGLRPRASPGRSSKRQREEQQVDEALIVPADGRFRKQPERRREEEGPGQVGIVIERGAELVDAPLCHRGLKVVLDVRIAALQQEVDGGLGLDHAAVVAVAGRAAALTQQGQLQARREDGQQDNDPDQTRA